MPRPSNFPRFRNPYNVMRGVQIMKLLIMQISPLFCYFLQGPNISLSTLFSNTLAKILLLI